MERREYSETMTALDGDSDFRRQLKPSALLRYVEQVSADHARAYGMDRQFFTEHHSAFLVAKTAVQITRRPMRAEKFTLTTACEVFKKGSMKRLTILTDTEGNRLALVDCRWMLVDTDTERIQRAPGWETEGFQNEELPEELPQLVHKSKDLQPAGEWVARYSLCDLNGHINNAAYLDIACDAIPLEVWRPRSARNFSPSSITARCRWGRRWRSFMPRWSRAGMWWAAGKSTPLLSATWNLRHRKHKPERITKK